MRGDVADWPHIQDIKRWTSRKVLARPDAHPPDRASVNHMIQGLRPFAKETDSSPARTNGQNANITPSPPPSARAAPQPPPIRPQGGTRQRPRRAPFTPPAAPQHPGDNSKKRLISIAVPWQRSHPIQQENTRAPNLVPLRFCSAEWSWSRVSPRPKWNRALSAFSIHSNFSSAYHKNTGLQFRTSGIRHTE